MRATSTVPVATSWFVRPRNEAICVHCCQNRPKVGIGISLYERSKCISLLVSIFEISALSYQIDVALSNGVGFQPIRIVVL